MDRKIADDMVVELSRENDGLIKNENHAAAFEPFARSLEGFA